MCTFVKFLLILTGSTLRFGQAVAKSDDFFDNYVEVPPAPPENFGAIPKCGEGASKGKFLCVPYFNCDPSTNTVMDYPEVDGSLIKNPRTGDDPRCGHHLEVCCRVRNSTTVDVEHAPTVNLEFEPTCGVKSRENEGEIPWMVGLLNVTSSSNRTFCGGSLLSPVVVLTAAHCVEKFQTNQIKIRVGEWDLRTTDGKITYQEKNVSEIIIHEHYFADALYNDVAILILNSSLHETNNIGTICIPQKLEDINQEDCLVTGWSQISSNIKPQKLKKISSSKVPNDLCQVELRKKVGKEFLLDRSFICARTKAEHDVCVGDGGSPLVCPDSSKRYFQIGIVSWGLDCGGTTPSVYANVIQYRDWINYKLTELGYNANPYTKNLI